MPNKRLESSSTEVDSVKGMKLHNLSEIASLVAADDVPLDLFIVSLPVQLVSHGRIQESVQLQ